MYHVNLTLDEFSQNKMMLKINAFGNFLLWIYSVFVMEYLLSVANKLYNLNLSEFSMVLILSLFSSVCAVSIIKFSLESLIKDSYKKFLACFYEKRSALQAIVVPILIGLFMAFLSALLMVLRAKMPDTPLGDLVTSEDNPKLIAFFILVAILFAPFLEEILFRGYIYKIALKVNSRKFAIIFTSLLFGSLHFSQYWGDWLALVVVTMLSFLLTYIRVYTGFTISSILAHYFYNAGVTVMTIIILFQVNPSYFIFKSTEVELEKNMKKELLEKSIAAQPKLSDAAYELSKLYNDEFGDQVKALRYAEQAIKYGPRNCKYYHLKKKILSCSVDYGIDGAFDIPDFCIK